jgi:hypothetical protein
MTVKVRAMCARDGGPHVVAKIEQVEGEPPVLRVREYIGSLEKRPRGDWCDFPVETWNSLVVIAACACGDLYTVYGDQMETAFNEGKKYLPLFTVAPDQWPNIATRWAQR